MVEKTGKNFQKKSLNIGGVIQTGKKEEKNRIILVLGAPGSGKSTQCKILAEKTGFLHISSGEMVREAIRAGNELGHLSESFVSKGALVPDVIMNDAILNKLKDKEVFLYHGGVLLDGYPRTLKQCIAICSNFEVERVIYLQIPDDLSFKRIVNRKDPNRNPESEDLIRTRVKFFNENIEEICGFFKSKVQVVDGNIGDIEVITETIYKLLQEPLVILKPTKEEKEKKVIQELCVVCMVNIADHLIVPCGHQCGCEECLKILSKNKEKCPICKGKINNLVKVFRSGVQDEIEQKNKNKIVESQIIKKGKINDNNNEEEKIYNAQEIENNIKISIAPCEAVKKDSKVNMGITINIPDTPLRRPIDICCVIDVSGSMGEDARFQDPEDETKTKTDGTSILDLVKHSVKACIHSLTDKDRLSIVTFDTKSRVVYALNEMNEDGIKKAVEDLEALQPLESTNIWAGLELGLESLRKTTDKIPRRKFVFLLTDGQPVDSPKDGEDGALTQYFKKHPKFSCQVNTFGFAYNLKSSLLLNIAVVGGGIFSFIPDAKIVGTNFVNSIANSVTTLCLNAKLHLIALGGSAMAGDVGGNVPFEKFYGKDGYLVKLGNLQYGQSRDVVVPMTLSKEEKYLAAILEYEDYDGGDIHKLTYVGTSREVNADSVAAFVRNYVISETMGVVNDLSNGKTVKGTKSMQALCSLVSNFDNATENEEPRVNGLTCDLVGIGEKGGRMSKAISTNERFNRWGQHYLRSISRAHQLQLRTNFIDIGLQVYGGETFKELQEIGGKIFVELPMIKSKINEVQSYGNVNNNNNNQNNTNQNQVFDNTDYYGGGGGGCFDESCLVNVLTKEGIVKTQIKNIEKNNLVSIVDRDGKVGYAKVLCVVKIKMDERERLIEFSSNGLKLTKTHPVWFDNKWQSPIDIASKYINIASVSQSKANFVYNLVLEHSHVLLVNGMKCVTLGHEIKEAYHPFYGTKNVIDFLKKSPGFKIGLVSCYHNIHHMKL